MPNQGKKCLAYVNSTEIKTPGFGWVREGRLYIRGRLLLVDLRFHKADTMPQTGFGGPITAFLPYDLAGVVLYPDNLSAVSVLKPEVPRNKPNPLWLLPLVHTNFVSRLHIWDLILELAEHERKPKHKLYRRFGAFHWSYEQHENSLAPSLVKELRSVNFLTPSDFKTTSGADLAEIFILSEDMIKDSLQHSPPEVYVQVELVIPGY